jgi:TonB family protein
MKRFLTVLTLSIVPLAASGQDSKPATATSSVNRSAWRMDETKSEMTDEPSVLLLLDATGSIPGQVTGTVTPTITLRCRERKLDAYVAFYMVLDGGVFDASPVRLRWNEDPPEKATWIRSTDYQSVFAPNAAAFIARLAHASRLRVEVRPFGKNAAVASFDVRGLDSLAPRLSKACPNSKLDSHLTRESSSARAARTGADSQASDDSSPSEPAAYFDFQVEKQASPQPGNVAPRYPDALRSGNVEGAVLVQFVVDTSGRVEMNTFKVLRSSHELFSSAASEAVKTWAFYPAEIRKRKVKQLIQHPFNFSLGR